MTHNVTGRLTHGSLSLVSALSVVALCAAPWGAAAQNASAPVARQITIERVFGDDKKGPDTVTQTLSCDGECTGTAAASGTSTVWFTFDQPTSTYGAVLSLTTPAADSAFELRTYTMNGQPLVASASSGSGLQVFVPAVLTGADRETRAVRGLIEVKLVAAGDDGPRSFSLAFRNITSAQPWRAQGHAQRFALSPEQYSALVRFGRCDSADPDATCLGKTAPTATADADSCDATCVASVHAITRGAIDSAAEREPVVAFIGLDGVDRTVLVDGSPEAPAPPHHHSLGAVKDVWVVYFEDDMSPFATSIDVEFTSRAKRRDFEEFDPAGQAVGRAAGASAYRVVEIGVRRFRVRLPPVAMEVTISRRGPGYGLRQWRTPYRVRSWYPVQFGAGIFVPAKMVNVDRHELPERALPDGRLPEDLIIVKEQAERPVFLTGSVSVPKQRRLVDNAFGRWAAYGWRTIPDLVVGIGLPASRSKAWYLGGSWPVAFERVSLSMGTLLIRQNKLREGYRVGGRQPFGTRIESLTFDKWVATFTMGVTVELVRSQ